MGFHDASIRGTKIEPRGNADPAIGRNLCPLNLPADCQTALVSLGVFYVLGVVIGEAARHIVEENAKADLVDRFGSASSPGTGIREA